MDKPKVNQVAVMNLSINSSRITALIRTLHALQT